MPKNIFVVGLDDFNALILKSMPRAGEFNFIKLLEYDQIVGEEQLRLPHWVDHAEAQLKAFDGPIDAIVGFWDFPTSSVLPILRQRVGLPTTSLEAVLKCEHKYWSRLEQQRAIPEHVPPFCAFDPFADDPRAQIELDFPFWIKPIKAHSSFLGFMIRGPEDLDHAIPIIRDKIEVFAKPFNYVLSHATLPPEIDGIDGWHCIAEKMISTGQQCTLEGYALDGEVVIYGVIDSVREGAHNSSFSRYQYPSQLSEGVQKRMIEAAKRLVRHMGYDRSPFNIEFYWDEESDRIAILEINARISKSHCPLFEEVDGSSHHQVMIDVALGEKPRFPHRAGRYDLAGKFMMRRFEDGKVVHAPHDQEIQHLKRVLPDARAQVFAKEGTRLADLKMQDSYSFELAEVFIGARDEKELLANYEKAVDILHFDFEPVREAA